MIKWFKATSTRLWDYEQGLHQVQARALHVCGFLDPKTLSLTIWTKIYRVQECKGNNQRCMGSKDQTTTTTTNPSPPEMSMSWWSVFIGTHGEDCRKRSEILGETRQGHVRLWGDCDADHPVWSPGRHRTTRLSRDSDLSAATSSCASRSWPFSCAKSSTA